ncbi:hypothetical protein GCM10020358_56120 [Amorphoplanes nipponensis]|uniref:DUF397 domain-containing protein n=1 Tax=Actinoplanes nipponensis TaxID=135950 RepID=A0A919JRZ1_9ACTN|nr:DUF397 domain-containing protein [Actinoplanes nipponensis]GIE51894.1 hypothetical protein Ani05nite_54280 [Actinoplanes nipponensis]
MSTLEQLEWRKSSFCAAANCVEVAQLAEQILVRDSKNPTAAPLSFTTEEWSAFVRGVNDGQFRFN